MVQKMSLFRIPEKLYISVLHYWEVLKHLFLLLTTILMVHNNDKPLFSLTTFQTDGFLPSCTYI